MDLFYLQYSLSALLPESECNPAQSYKVIPIGSYNLLIAATAKTYNLKLVTSNAKEFERVPRLMVENWREAQTT